MFDAGFLEVMIVGIIALLVVGPERLPGVARKVGGWVGKARAFVDSTKADIEREINASEMRELLQNQKKEIDELRHMMDDTTKDIGQQTAEIKDSIQSGIDDAMKPSSKANNNE